MLYGLTEIQILGVLLLMIVPGTMVGVSFGIIRRFLSGKGSRGLF